MQQKKAKIQPSQKCLWMDPRPDTDGKPCYPTVIRTLLSPGTRFETRSMPIQLCDFKNKRGHAVSWLTLSSTTIGCITRPAVPLQWSLPSNPDKDEWERILAHVQPADLGEIEDARGFEFTKTSFIVDTRGFGWRLSSDHVCSIVRRFAACIPYNASFLKLMNNRAWSARSAWLEPRVEPIVPDAYYAWLVGLKTSIITDHTPAVCHSRSFLCHKKISD
jgi:hypothetical protein